MTQTKHICDRCGKEIPGYLTFLKFTAAKFKLTTWGYTTRERNAELCDDCQKSFKKWLENKEG